MNSPARWFGIAWLLIAATRPIGAAPGDARLIEAVKIADVQPVRALVAQPVDVTRPDVDGPTALHWAARRDNPALVDLLLTAGANPRAATRYNVTPLGL